MSRGPSRSRRSEPSRRQPLTLRHPRGFLAVAAVVLVVLGVIGTGVEGKLDPTTLNVPGTASSAANELQREHFGESAPFAILLEGPAAAIDRQGPELVRALRRNPAVTTLSPWDQGSVQVLRPVPGRALVIADFHVDTKTAVNDTVPELDQILEDNVRAPVEATQTGFATISRSLQDESISAAERGELLALPFLLIVLLLVFRSPVAAAIPLAFGAVTVIASRGILYFFTGWFDIDAFALVVCTMMGLALGVDYALLMVSRFREELANGVEPVEAARLTRRTAGRTTMFAGSTLLVSMLTSLLILPGSLLASLAGTVAMVAVLSVSVATLVGPPLLALIGTNVDRWRIGPAPGGRSRLMAFVNAALKRPAAAAALIGFVLVVLAAPALALKTGPPSPEQLPIDSAARTDAEKVDAVVGPGWDAPFQVIAVSKDGPITDPPSLAAVQHFQNRVAELPGVQAVIGPGGIAKRIEPLQELGNAVLSSEGNVAAVKQLGRLGRQLNVAAGGVSELRDGITEASDGAGLLALGADHAGEAAELIANGMARAATGSGKAIAALEQFAKGSRQLEEAIQSASNASLQLRFGIEGLLGATLKSNGLRPARKLQQAIEAEANKTVPKLLGPAKEADAQLKAALAQLQGMTVGQTDPNYAAALAAVQRAAAAVSGTDPVSGAPFAPEYVGLPTELEGMQARLLEDVKLADKVADILRSTVLEGKKLSNGAKQIYLGLTKIHSGANKLASGAEQLSAATSQLGQGIARLGAGASALVGGLGQLSTAIEALQVGLAEGAEEIAPQEGRLQRASVRILEGKAQFNKQVSGVAKTTPGLFNSGYFVLSAVDGSPPQQREAVSNTIDLPNGGQAASVLVISRFTFNSKGSQALNKRLNGSTAALGEQADLETGVAGGAAQLNEYGTITRDRMPFVIAAITLVTFLILILVLRAIPLAAIAVGLNLLTVGVAFGILTLLTHLPASTPLGGHANVEVIGAMMIFGIVFGLSIDYAVFLLSRMREHYDRHGDNAAAIQFGLEKTARVITGAAAIMLAVFISFASTPLATVSQLGVGLTVAVILDATVVRIVLLPALMLLIGDRVWWLPGPLKRALPKLSV
jgi:RND superfamily putative drug exporter